MSFTYQDDLSRPIDQARFFIGDTDSSTQLFTDEEINGSLLVYGAPIDTAIALATAQAAKYSRKPSQVIDGYSINYRELSQNFIALAQQLRKQKAEGPGAMGAYVGGVSVADVASVETDTDRTPSQFKIGMDDDPPNSAWDIRP